MMNHVISPLKILFSTLIFSVISFAKTPSPQIVGLQTPVAIEQPGVDIPLVGSSAFDKLFFKTKQKKYQIPYPIHDLVKHISQQNDSILSIASFPFSRSLQRPVDLSYNPLEYPRMVFAVNSGNNFFLRNKLFFAFSEPRDQLEVISYNEQAGRYEFQIVKNYSTKPQVFYAPRAKCLSCHQGQAPILSEHPWNDSASPSRRDSLSQLLNQAQGFSLATSDHEAAQAFGYKVDSLSMSVANVDITTRAAQRLQHFQRYYTYGCISRECRLGVLLKELGLCQSYMDPLEACRDNKELPLSPLYQQNWAPSEVSDDIQLIILQKEFGIFHFTKPSLIPENLHEDPVLIQRLLDHLKMLPTEDNPAASRLRPIAQNHHSFKFSFLNQFNFIGQFSSFTTLLNQENFNKKTKENSRIRKALFELYSNGDSLFDQKPLSFYELSSKVEAHLGLPRTVFKAMNLDIKDFAQLSSDIPESAFSRPILNSFVRQCGQCHQNTQNYPSSFLLGPEEIVLTNLEAYKEKIAKRLRNKEMPPTQKLQETFEGSEDAKVIQEWLRGESYFDSPPMIH